MTLIVLFHGLAFGAGMENRQTLGLKLGQSKIITTLLPFKRVAIAADNIADVVVLSPTEAYIYGKTLGYTSVMLWEEGKGKTMLDVVVSIDLTGLKEKIHQLYPDQQIKV
ncbi:MAG: pilus assembly protein N-terminal domain-containing protein, partial [Desulfobulbaceae bacterium]|nr:pilus assembly protein N-terminal domain-containing protein [Desulfobulbaceae bacterium]